MGCNTSKESVQPVEGEEKTEEKVEEPTQTEQETQDSVKDNTSKPASATTLKAVTPSGESAKSAERLSNHLAASTPEPPGDESDPLQEADTDETVAATKIQAVFRGHQTRKTMKHVQQPQNEPEPTREQLEAEFRADDVELCKAATTIQNSFRSHLKTKQDDGGKVGEGSAASKEDKEEELDIDLTDPDLNKAATKIQASFRGHKVRKDTNADDQ